MATKSELEKEYDDLKKEFSDQISKERAKLKAKLAALDQVESFSNVVDAITKAFGCFNEALDEIEKKSTPKEYPTRETDEIPFEIKISGEKGVIIPSKKGYFIMIDRVGFDHNERYLPVLIGKYIRQ
jgi:hypothetical protein